MVLLGRAWLRPLHHQGTPPVVVRIQPYILCIRTSHSLLPLVVARRRVAELKKEENYAPMLRTNKSFIPLAYDVFGGAAPKAEDFLKQMASLVVQKTPSLNRFTVHIKSKCDPNVIQMYSSNTKTFRMLHPARPLQQQEFRIVQYFDPSCNKM